MASQPGVVRIIIIPFDTVVTPHEQVLSLPAIQSAVSGGLAIMAVVSTAETIRFSGKGFKWAIRIEIIVTAIEDVALMAQLMGIQQSLQNIRLDNPDGVSAALTPITEAIVTWSYPITYGF